MSENINWPPGEFTIQAAVACNPKLPQAEVARLAGITVHLFK